MKLSQSILRGALAFVGMVVVQFIAGMLVPIKAPSVPHTVEWLLLSNAIIAAALTVAAVRSDWRGWQVGAAIAAVPLAITSVDLLEGSVFLTHSSLPWNRLFANAIVSAILIIPVWTLLFGRRERIAEHYHPIQAKGRGERAWRFALSDFSYLLLYYLAGMIIFPFVKDFYATQHLPSMGTIVALQLLIRGPVFVVVCIALTRMLGLGRLQGAIAVGAVFTLISGVAPLIVPNPVFPDSVRWVHFCEVVSENFVFGAIVAWLWGHPQVIHAPVLAAQKA
jgi:hypothetical protein